MVILCWWFLDLTSFPMPRNSQKKCTKFIILVSILVTPYIQISFAPIAILFDRWTVVVCCSGYCYYLIAFRGLPGWFAIPNGTSAQLNKTQWKGWRIVFQFFFDQDCFISLMVPFALCLQQFGIRPVILHGISYILACAPSILHATCHVFIGRTL